MNKINFADKLIGRIRYIGTPLCVGLDPILDKIPFFFHAFRDPCKTVYDFLSNVLMRLKGKVPIVKINSAYFEKLILGPYFLEKIIKLAKTNEILTILDAKRSDIGHSAQAYAESYLSEKSFISPDAITICPYIGIESIHPFANECYKSGKGLFVLIKTSNPGFSVQNLISDGKPVYWHVANSIVETSKQLIGANGWSSMGVVVGANYSDSARVVREVLPNSIFLTPGYGAQGASVEDAMASFVPMDGMFKGGIINSSRKNLYFDGADEVDSEEEWNEMFDNNLNKTIEFINKASLKYGIKKD